MPPTEAMTAAVCKVLSPHMSKVTKDALENKKRKRARVQAQSGEVLTTEEVRIRMKIEEEKRHKKKAKKPRTGNSNGKLDDAPLYTTTIGHEEDSMKCYLCDTIFIDEQGSNWVECEGCENWCCMPCTPGNFIPEVDSYFCHSCI